MNFNFYHAIHNEKPGIVLAITAPKRVSNFPLGDLSCLIVLCHLPKKITYLSMLIIEFLVRLLFDQLKMWRNFVLGCSIFMFFNKMLGTTNSNCNRSSDIPSKDSFSRDSNDN